jgi:channel protein (hemolysin III family)
MTDDHRDNTFVEFERMTREILEHKDLIEKIDFSSRMKNGTRFTFNFNLRRWERKQHEGGKIDHSALFNGIFDIVAIGISIALLTILIIYAESSGRDFMTVTYSLFGSVLIIYNLLSSLYHFFSASQSTKVIFDKLKNMFRFFVIMTAVTPVYLQFLSDEKGLLLFMIVMVLGAVGIFLTYTDTETSRLVSRIISGIMPLIMLSIIPILLQSFGNEATILLCFSSLLYAFWSFSPLLWKKSSNSSVNFSNFFMVAGSLGFLWLFLELM